MFFSIPTMAFTKMSGSATLRGAILSIRGSRYRQTSSRSSANWILLKTGDSQVCWRRAYSPSSSPILATILFQRSQRRCHCWMIFSSGEMTFLDLVRFKGSSPATVSAVPPSRRDISTSIKSGLMMENAASNTFASSSYVNASSSRYPIFLFIQLSPTNDSWPFMVKGVSGQPLDRFLASISNKRFLAIHG